jgi:hypothetical protein
MRVLIVVCLCGCAAASPSSAVLPPVREVQPVAATIAVPGEQMEMEVRLRGIVVGHVQVGLGEPGVLANGRRAIIAKTRATTDGVISLLGDMAWELTSTIDLDTGAVVETHEDDRERMIGGSREQHHSVTRHYEVDDDHHDLHGAIGALRANAATLAPGAEVTMPVELGGGRFDVTIWLVGREVIKGAKTPSSHYRGTADGKIAFDLWMSDDTARVPQHFHCKTPLGGLDIDLVDYR